MVKKTNQLNTRKIAEEIFREGVKSVLPSVLIPSQVKLKENSLYIGTRSFPLEHVNKIYVIGAGKASALMASEVEKILGSKITKGHVIVKYGHSCRLNHIRVTEAGHPVPDSNGFKATRDILSIASSAGAGDLVLCLISGGGSALLADHPDGCTPGEMIIMNDLLVNCGADISEINAVRKHISSVKGGQLARAVFPAHLVSLILSDVPGDPLDVIASGPSSPDLTTFSQALGVLEKYDLMSRVPQGIINFLLEGEKGLHPDTPKSGDEIFSRTHNFLIGTNRLALEAASQAALGHNFRTIIMDSGLQGDAATVADNIIETSIRIQTDKNEAGSVCLLFGGETTLKMTGKGMGGRNQHLALLAAILLKNHPGITFLSGGTDGNDGPTDAAGAVVDSDTYINGISGGLKPEKFIHDFDSYNFFKKSGGHIITGPTMTNVMDIIVVIIQ